MIAYLLTLFVALTGCGTEDDPPLTPIASATLSPPASLTWDEAPVSNGACQGPVALERDGDRGWAYGVLCWESTRCGTVYDLVIVADDPANPILYREQLYGPISEFHLDTWDIDDDGRDELVALGNSWDHGSWSPTGGRILKSVQGAFVEVPVPVIAGASTFSVDQELLDLNEDGVREFVEWSIEFGGLGEPTYDGRVLTWSEAGGILIRDPDLEASDAFAAAHASWLEDNREGE